MDCNYNKGRKRSYNNQKQEYFSGGTKKNNQYKKTNHVNSEYCTEDPDKSQPWNSHQERENNKNSNSNYNQHNPHYDQRSFNNNYYGNYKNNDSPIRDNRNNQKNSSYNSQYNKQGSFKNKQNQGSDFSSPGFFNGFIGNLEGSYFNYNEEESSVPHNYYRSNPNNINSPQNGNGKYQNSFNNNEMNSNYNNPMSYNRKRTNSNLNFYSNFMESAKNNSLLGNTYNYLNSLGLENIRDEKDVKETQENTTNDEEIQACKETKEEVYVLSDHKSEDPKEELKRFSSIHTKNSTISQQGIEKENKQRHSKEIQENARTKIQQQLLNESISTTYTALTSYTTSPKGTCNRYSLKNLYENYLEAKYPDMAALQRKFSVPFTNINIVKNSTYYIIKSFNIENIHKAIKYGVWSTTYSGNNAFDKAYVDAQNRNAEVYLFFSTNSTFAFQGIARLKSKFQNKSYNFWKGSDKYKSFHGSFNIDWIVIKDVPNSTLDKVAVNNIPFSKLRNGVEINEADALLAIKLIECFYFCSSLVLSDFMRLDYEEKQCVDSGFKSKN